MMCDDQADQPPMSQFRVEDGELVLSDCENQDEKLKEDSENSGSKKSRRKQTFERRNIKKVREDAFNQEAKAAQKAEMERRKRLVERDKNDSKFTNMDYLLSDGIADNQIVLKPDEDDFMTPKKAKLDSEESSSDSDADSNLKFDEPYKKEEIALGTHLTIEGSDSTLSGPAPPLNEGSDAPVKPIVSTASASLFGSTWAAMHSHRMGQSQDDAILLGDSDDEQEKHPQDSMVIEVSDGEEEPEEVEIEAEVCELQDAENVADADGKIVVNTSRDKESEPEICLAAQIARVIKPHQVSGIRFLYNNLVESLSRFQSTEGFGCILAHSMGLGKTIQIIGFLDILFRYCQAKRVLVIVPINTIQNWQAEFELWLPLNTTHQPLVNHPRESNTMKSNNSQLDEMKSNNPQLDEMKSNNPQLDEMKSNNPQLDEMKSNNPQPNETLDLKPLDGHDTVMTAKPDNPSDIIPDSVPKQDEFWSSCFPLPDEIKNDEANGNNNNNNLSENMCTNMHDQAQESTTGLPEQKPNSELIYNIRPFKLFVVRDTLKTVSQRHQVIQQWHEEGGVLLLGYEMFRLLLNQKRPSITCPIKPDLRQTKRKRKNMVIDIEKEEKREKMWTDFHAALLDPGPELVICDEGHRIKNSEASISKALKAIRTHRRVVLTGYPLQNNLMEYWCMVDFVRPNYLGTKHEFTNMFQRPIENGQCIDSTPEDRKVMQGRAHVLHDLLSGFVQRRSHAVLKASLPTKTEIVLLIKLSPLQRRLYAAFMRSLGSAGPFGWAQVNTLKTYAMCCKIWNHPDILWRAMEEHKEAMDFDIDDPSANNSNSSSGAHTFRRCSTSVVPLNRSESQSSVAASDSDITFESAPVSSTNPSESPSSFSNNGTLVPSGPALNLSFQSPTSTTTPTSFPSHTSSPAFLYNQPASNQTSAGTYDWALDSTLWGEDFQPGHIEHSGKVLLFLSLLKASVLAGDKMLVFTQSLYTLDLLERILRRLPLPESTDPNIVSYTFESTQTSDAPISRTTEVSNSSPKASDHPVETGVSNEMDLKEDEPKLTQTTLDHTSSNQFEDSLVDNSLVKSTDTACFFSNDRRNSPTVEQPSEVQAPATQLSEPTHSTSTIQETKTNDTSNPQLGEQEEHEEENLRSLHYRLATRQSKRHEPVVWTRNVHYFRLDGSTTATEREKLINNFNDRQNPAKLFLVSTRAGCLGVNLIGANRVVVFDASWNPCHDCQAVCRVYRYGQKKPCYIYRLVSDNTMEKKIYDRQVTKQGMSDRVVDELNPTQQFTRSQVELLMSFEDKDMETITDGDLEQCAAIVQPDPVLQPVLNEYKGWITKRPFTHESLLIDRKDYRLTRVEKRLAKQRYEQEKRLSLSYQQAHLFQLQQMQAFQQQQHLISGMNPSLLDSSRLYSSRTPNILSRSTINYRPTYTSGSAALDAMRQVDRINRSQMLEKELSEARKRYSESRTVLAARQTENQEYKITRIVASTDLYFPSTSNSTTTQRKIPKGELLEVIQSQKGKFLRICRTGDLFVVKTSSNQTTTDTSSADATESSNSKTDSTDDAQKTRSEPASHTLTSTSVVTQSSTVNPNESYRLSDSSSSSNNKANNPSTVTPTKITDRSSKNESYQLSNQAPISSSQNPNFDQHSFIRNSEPIKDKGNSSSSFTDSRSVTYPNQFASHSSPSFSYPSFQNTSRPSESMYPKNHASTSDLVHPQVKSMSNQSLHDKTESFNGADDLPRFPTSLTSHSAHPSERAADHENAYSNRNFQANTTFPRNAAQLEQQQQQQQQQWNCPMCNRPTSMGCSCSSTHASSSNLTNVSSASSVFPNFGNYVNQNQSQVGPSEQFTNSNTTSNTASSNMFANNKDYNPTTNFPYYPNPNDSNALTRQMQQQQQQQQLPYSRPSEQPSRQSTVPNSYLGGFYDSVYSNNPRSSTAAAATAAAAAAAAAQQALRMDPNLAALHNNPASVMQNYFSHLSSAGSPRRPTLDSDRSKFANQSHLMIAAMEQHFGNSVRTSPPNMISQPNTAHLNNINSDPSFHSAAAASTSSCGDGTGNMTSRNPNTNVRSPTYHNFALSDPSARSSSSSSYASTQQNPDSNLVQPNNFEAHTSPQASMFSHLQSPSFLPNFRFPQF